MNKFKNAVIAFVLVCVGLYAGEYFKQPTHVEVGQGHFNWTNPDAKFSTSKNFTNQSTITWTPVDNIQATCERESKARGLGGFGFGVQACSFWNGSSCTIFTPKQASIHNLGHEALHCFQGKYH